MSGGGQTSTSTSTIQYTPAQQRIIDLASGNIEDWLSQGGVTLPGYSAISGFDPASKWGQRFAMREARGGLTDLSNMWKKNAQFIGNEGQNPDSNPYLSGAARSATDPLYDRLMKEVLPTVRGEAITSGMFGGSGQGLAEAAAIKDTQKQAADTMGGMYAGAYEGGQNRLLQMLGMSDQISKGILAPASVADMVGQQRQRMAQARLQEQYMRDIYKQMAPFLSSREAIAAIMQGGTGSKTVNEQPGPDLFSQIFGGFMSLAGLFF